MTLTTKTHQLLQAATMLFQKDAKSFQKGFKALENGAKAIILYLFALMPVISAAETDAIGGLLSRILPYNDDAQKFEYSIAPSADGKDYFTISCDGAKVSVKGNNNVSIATGINWFLQHKAGVDIAWNNPKDRLPEVLPTVAEETHRASVPVRYYLNFCTHSYTMAFWGWERWQQEIDWMALHGINLPLIIEGMECVWKQVLQDGYGYTGLDGVNAFVTGAAYYGWFFMNNMTAWGGPQPESWFQQRQQLAKQIFLRLNEYGMTPVIPGYVGMVPKDFLSYAAKDSVSQWQASDIVNGGTWNQFTRPYFVNNTTRLKEFAAKYYKAIDDVYGDVLKTHYYAIDPFHEGGVPSGVSSAKNSIVAMWEALKAYDSDAVWVAQHWQGNPTTDLTRTIPAGKLLVLDLHGDSNGDTSLSGNNTDANGNKHEWIWGQTSNFGGNVGLFGRLPRLLSSFYTAVSNQSANNIQGIGAIPEGIENNNILYDLLYALPWTSTNYTQDSWLRDYVFMRYGVNEQKDSLVFNTVLSAWTRLANGIYNCQSNGQQGTTESVFMMRPKSSPGQVSTWAGSSWYWDIEDLRTATYEMLQVADELQNNDNFRYDVVDILRQALADYGKQTLEDLALTTSTAERNSIINRFLGLILDQDTLVGTRTELRFGRWTEMARALGQSEAERTLYEKNARMLVTTWGDRQQCESGQLHDYGNREWNGLLSSYYYPRWKAYFENNMQGQSWFDNYEWPFVNGADDKPNVNYLPDGAPYAYGTFTAEAQGDELETAKRLYKKYFSDFKPKTWALSAVDTTKIYLLTNASTWRSGNGVDGEGLNLSSPNSDYPDGYRLQRSALNAKDHSFWWRFVKGGRENTYRLINVKAQEEGQYGAYLNSTPSSTTYPAFTLKSEGSDYYVYQNGEEYYLQDAGTGVFMSPDVAWASACVLVSAARTTTSLLHLIDPQSLGRSEFNNAVSPRSVYQIIFTRGTAIAGSYDVTADATGKVRTTGNSLNVSTAILSDNKASALTSTLWRFRGDSLQTWLQNVQTGLWVGAVSNSKLQMVADSAKARAYTIEASGSRYVAKDESMSGNNYLNSFYGDSNTGARNIGYWRDGFSDQGNIFAIKEVVSLPLEIGADEWAAFSFPVGVTVPEGVEVYAVTDISADQADIVQIPEGNLIPAFSGVIAHAQQGSYDFPISITDSAADSSPKSLLSAVPVARTGITRNSIYLLQITTNGQPALVRSTATSLSANTAFLPVSLATGAATTLLLSTETGIHSATQDPDGRAGDTNKRVDGKHERADMKSAHTEQYTTYDLQGRTASASQKGILIRNGKKVYSNK